MLQYMAKIFMMQFPLYSGPKQAGQRNEEVIFKHRNYIRPFGKKTTVLLKTLEIYEY